MSDVEKIVKAIKECEYLSKETKGLIYDIISRATSECRLYNEEEFYPNCTVHILRNSVTGDESIGWWDNDDPPAGIAGWEEVEDNGY